MERGRGGGGDRQLVEKGLVGQRRQHAVVGRHEVVPRRLGGERAALGADAGVHDDAMHGPPREAAPGTRQDELRGRMFPGGISWVTSINAAPSAEEMITAFTSAT